MKCSFEETVEILMDAAIYNEIDHVRSVSENVIMGQTCPVGTGVFDLYMCDEREKNEDGTLGNCDLDLCAAVIPPAKGREIVSMASPIGSPGQGTPAPIVTPHEDQVELDVAGGTVDNLNDLPTPIVTLGE